MQEKAGQKMNAISRAIPYMNITKWCTLLNAFFISKFNYYPLTEMSPSREKKKKKERTVSMKDILE